ncbi:LPXTG cell wall anchor domain-containing protein, partial [Georgenia halophila]|uniref:DUF7927 domain-containing protein n=1 Tax=Georgenia halophila TaxID=620889 RepID=UPI0031EA1AAB
DDAQATAGEVAFEEPELTWAGPLEVDEEVTLTYSVTVTAEGDRHLVNVVTTDGQCVPAQGQDEACTTEHLNGAYVYSKTSDPESGSQVGQGDVVTYTVVVEQVGTAGVEDAIVVDDLSGVFSVADWNGDASASSGTLERAGDQLTWTGDLEVDQVVTLTYSVTVGDEPDATMDNVVTSPDERGSCVPAADGNPGCATEHHTASAPLIPGLPNTGAPVSLATVLGAMLLVGVGGGFMGLSRRRRLAAGTTTPGMRLEDLL